MPAVSEEMVIDAVDGSDSPVGVVRRDQVFALGVNFRVVHILIFNSSGELLIQQLAGSRRRHPGYWGSSVAGYIFSNESYETAAKRRLREELNITPARLNFLGKTVMNDQECEKFIGVFTATDDGPFEFDRHLIESIEFVPVSRIRKLQYEGSLKFTPTFLQVIDFYQSVE